MKFSVLSLVLVLLFIPTSKCQVQEFISIDCGGANNYTDPSTKLEWISDTQIMNYGKCIDLQNENNESRINSPQYQKRRDFPTDKKYCYTLNTEQRRRYVVRASFLYGNPENEDVFPKFELYLDATKWATVTIRDAYRVNVEEMIIRAPSRSIDVCLCCATTGSPFISTLELRPLNLSMYATDYEDDFYLKVAARVNFGALSTDIIRYPDDPYDRIWDSDLEKRPNYLVGVAPGTKRINTTKNINVETREYPPVKVMQTAVEGTQGVLSYRLNLEDFPANARAYAYFAEIEDLKFNETRKFKMEEPYMVDYSNAVVNIAENANGSYTLYEPSYMNVTLDFVLSFEFAKTPDSDRGPLLNAIEISRYVAIAAKTNQRDVNVLNALRSMSSENDSTNEGDPCVPTTWEWVSCSSTTTPPRITKIMLSGKNVQGEIPSDIGNMEELTELWLDRNSLTGPIPDMSNLIHLKLMHLENNKLSGNMPTSMGSLPSLRELYIQNNSLSGVIPTGLISGNVTIKYKGNHGLRPKAKHNTNSQMILGISIGVLSLLAMLLVSSVLLLCNLRNKTSHPNSDDKGGSTLISTKPSSRYSITRGGHLMDEGVAVFIPLPVIEVATDNFSTRIGKGSFGPVYYGKMKGGKEVAVKIMADPTSHGTKQFVTEVALLSRIHHRNLVPLIGYCEEANHRMLIYEYMHNGTLRDHIHGTAADKPLDWLARLSIAEDTAKGLEYLHTGCNPSIIHRDVKTSNILLDIHMRAKVSDFGLSRQNIDDLTHISSAAQGTVGYLDPEYYGNQQLTDKSDVYSFGVVLLELISGRKPVTEDYGDDWNIVLWARSLVRKGDAISMVDPSIMENLKIESVWRVAEVAVECVQQHGYSRPKMQEIILAIQDAIRIQKRNNEKILSTDTTSPGQSARKTLLTSFLEIESPDISNGSLYPSAR